jgi:polyphenol oxidase
VILDTVSLGDAARGWFTGRDVDAPTPAIGQAGNLAHRRPHQPAELARTRRQLGERTGLSPDRWHLMAQVHGAAVGSVTTSTPPGAEFRGVDALVTAVPDRPLAVQVADCVPVLLAGGEVVAAVHAGRQGVAHDVVGATLEAMGGYGAEPADVHAAIGPAIGGCCYEVPAALRDEVAERAPEVAATTTWGTPSLDLPAAVTARLAAAGVRAVQHVGGCTHCDPAARWFSHRRDPASGRQLGLVVRPGPALGEAGA